MSVTSERWRHSDNTALFEGDLTKLYCLTTLSSGDLITIFGAEQEQGEVVVQIYGGKRGIF